MTLTRPQRSELDRTHFFINGTWVEPRGTETHLALEAATEQPLGTAAMGTDADIDAAVTAARAALDEGPWGRTTAAARAEAMHRFADALAARADTTSELSAAKTVCRLLFRLRSTEPVRSGCCGCTPNWSNRLRSRRFGPANPEQRSCAANPSVSSARSHPGITHKCWPWRRSHRRSPPDALSYSSPHPKQRWTPTFSVTPP